MGTFHVGVVCSQKIVVLQGQWKERDVPLLVSGQDMPLRTGTCGFAVLVTSGVAHARNKRESGSFATRAVFSKEMNSLRTEMLFSSLLSTHGYHAVLSSRLMSN